MISARFTSAPRLASNSSNAPTALSYFAGTALSTFAHAASSCNFFCSRAVSRFCLACVPTSRNSAGSPITRRAFSDSSPSRSASRALRPTSLRLRAVKALRTSSVSPSRPLKGISRAIRCASCSIFASRAEIAGSPSAIARSMPTVSGDPMRCPMDMGSMFGPCMAARAASGSPAACCSLAAARPSLRTGSRIFWIRSRPRPTVCLAAKLANLAVGPDNAIGAASPPRTSRAACE